MKLGGQIFGMIWSQKFSGHQDLVLLFVWHGAESCCQTEGLLEVTHSIQRSPTFSKYLCVETEAMWKNEWGHNVTVANDHQKQFDGDGVFGFYYNRYILSSQWLFGKFTI